MVLLQPYRSPLGVTGPPFKTLYETCVVLAGAVGRFRYGSGMGQIGEDRQATPDVVAPVKGSPLASSAPYDVAPPLPRESVAGKPC
jgi:hypothetical protein